MPAPGPVPWTSTSGEPGPGTRWGLDARPTVTVGRRPVEVMGGSPSCRSATNHAGSCLIHAVASRAVDVLTDLLQRSRARGAAFSHSTAHGDWGVAFGQVPGLAVHAIV